MIIIHEDEPERILIQNLTLQLSFDNIKSLDEIYKDTKAKVMSEILAWKELLKNGGAPWYLRYVLEADDDAPWRRVGKEFSSIIENWCLESDISDMLTDGGVLLYNVS